MNTILGKVLTEFNADLEPVLKGGVALDTAIYTKFGLAPAGVRFFADDAAVLAELRQRGSLRAAQQDTTT